MGMAFISIEYRLSPEYPFPSGLSDCESVVLVWQKHMHRKFGIDPSKTVLMGDSAGGNLAAVVSRRARLAGYPVKAQVLVYPLLQFHDMMLPSYQSYYAEYSKTAFLDPRSIARLLLLYVGVHATEDRIQAVLSNNHTGLHLEKAAWDRLSHDLLPSHVRNVPYYSGQAVPAGDQELYSQLEPYLYNADFSPMMADDLDQSPPTVIVTCEYDILRDEGLIFGRHLMAHGVRVHQLHYEGGFHGMWNFHSEINVASKSMDDIAYHIKNILS
jgi:acetyl esterase/lipase